jgi:hypothetical protein
VLHNSKLTHTPFASTQHQWLLNITWQRHNPYNSMLQGVWPRSPAVCTMRSKFLTSMRYNKPNMAEQDNAAVMLHSWCKY